MGEKHTVVPVQGKVQSLCRLVWHAKFDKQSVAQIHKRLYHDALLKTVWINDVDSVAAFPLSHSEDKPGCNTTKGLDKVIKGGRGNGMGVWRLLTRRLSTLRRTQTHAWIQSRPEYLHDLLFGFIFRGDKGPEACSWNVPESKAVHWNPGAEDTSCPQILVLSSHWAPFLYFFRAPVWHV